VSDLFIYRGLPGSGKTTAARALQNSIGGRLVGRDALRSLLFGDSYLDSWPPDQDKEAHVTQLQDGLIRDGLRRNDVVIVDDMNLRSRYISRFAEIAREEGAALHVIDHTDVDVEVCIARDAGRGRSVGEPVIRDLHKRFIQGRGHPLPVPELPNPPVLDVEPYEPDLSKPKAVIVDIDGTVALHNGRDPYDYGRVYEDLPNWPVVRMVRAAMEDGYRLVFVSGRPDSCRVETRLWLNRWLPCSDESLFMRRADDSRNDAIVKLEIFNDHLRNQFNIMGVFDDRQRVVDMWRSLGLTVFQVAPGAF
jgi:predicted kinase